MASLKKKENYQKKVENNDHNKGNVRQVTTQAIFFNKILITLHTLISIIFII